MIALDRVRLVGLLPQLYPQISAPRAVIAEYGHCPAWLREVPVQDRSAVRALLARNLDLGESEAIVYALTLPDALLLIDEARGRRAAEQAGLKIVGTAGVLISAKAMRLIPAVKPVLDTLLQDHDFRLSGAIYRAALRASGEA
ncbi:MAG: DUF3368 domain-containing protein [Bacteroidota bacterium]